MKILKYLNVLCWCCSSETEREEKVKLSPPIRTREPTSILPAILWDTGNGQSLWNNPNRYDTDDETGDVVYLSGQTPDSLIP